MNEIEWPQQVKS